MAKAKKTDSGSGTPAWVPIVGVLVAASGAIYAWFSHFSPKPEPTKPPATSTAAPQVSVSGAGSVGAGSVSGSTINVGSPQASSQPTASSGKSAK